MTTSKRIRLNIYIDDEEMRRQVKIAAARRDMTVTEYCKRAIVEQLRLEGEAPGMAQPQPPKVSGEGRLAVIRRTGEARRTSPVEVKATEIPRGERTTPPGGPVHEAG